MLLSGGIDSATCLYLANKKGYRNSALTVRFHGIARGEVRAAQHIAKSAGVREHRFVSVPQIRELSDMTPESGRFSGLPSTYIPMKNATFYSLAAGYAEEMGASCIVGGHNREDSDIFEDTSSAFFGNLQRAFRAGSARLRERRLRIWRPLKDLRKVEVLLLARSLGVPLGMTWSCHMEGDRHCWRCEGCRGRVETFARAGISDPLRAQGTGGR